MFKKKLNKRLGGRHYSKKTVKKMIKQLNSKGRTICMAKSFLWNLLKNSTSIRRDNQRKCKFNKCIFA